jgi:hypothetical protein
MKESEDEKEKVYPRCASLDTVSTVIALPV